MRKELETIEPRHRLESNARWARKIAEEEEKLAREGISDMPCVEEYRLFERIAVLD
jgi:hypothetical protein